MCAYIPFHYFSLKKQSVDGWFGELCSALYLLCSHFVHRFISTVAIIILIGRCSRLILHWLLQWFVTEVNRSHVWDSCHVALPHSWKSLNVAESLPCQKELPEKNRFSLLACVTMGTACCGNCVQLKINLVSVSLYWHDIIMSSTQQFLGAEMYVQILGQSERVDYRFEHTRHSCHCQHPFQGAVPCRSSPSAEWVRKLCIHIHRELSRLPFWLLFSNFEVCRTTVLGF